MDYKSKTRQHFTTDDNTATFMLYLDDLMILVESRPNEDGFINKNMALQHLYTTHDNLSDRTKFLGF